MEGLGQLAHVKGGDALAYRKGGHALVYKGEPRPITIRIPWSPQAYVCRTYSMYHDLVFTSALSGGEVLESVTSGAEHMYKVRVAQAPATIRLTIGGHSGCSAVGEDPPEIPEMSAEVMAGQRGSDVMSTGSIGGICMAVRHVSIAVDDAGTIESLEVA